MSDRWKRVDTSRGPVIARITLVCGDDGDAESGPMPYCEHYVREVRSAVTGRPVNLRVPEDAPDWVVTELMDEIYQGLEEDP